MFEEACTHIAEWWMKHYCTLHYYYYGVSWTSEKQSSGEGPLQINPVTAENSDDSRQM